MLGKLAVGAITYVMVFLSYLGWILTGSTKLSKGFEIFCFIALLLIPLYCAVSGVYCLDMYGLI